jgi:hypothetical protein
MQSKEINQLSFEKGMIENIKQESFGENLGSCLVLENWDNSIEIGSVLKRYGLGTYTPTFPNDSQDYNGNRIDRYKDLGSHVMSEVVHTTVLNTANPIINDTFVMILQNNNYPDKRCRIIGFVPYNEPSKPDDRILKIPNKDRINWRNTHNPDDLIDTKYRGWDIKGLYRCSATYGESLAIGTQPDNITITNTTDYFPLYIWKLMDLSKKREKGANFFFNGIDMDMLNPNAIRYDQIRVFNVKNPKQAIRKNNFCKVKGFNGYNGTWYDNTPPDSALTVIVTEEELRYNSFYSFDRWKTTDKFTNENVKTMCYPNPNVNKWYQKGVKVVKSFEYPTFQFADNIENTISNSVPADNGMKNSNAKPFTINKRTITNNAGIDLDLLLINPNAGPNEFNPGSTCNEQDISSDMYFKVNDNSPFKGISGTNVNYVQRCITFAMPDYISNNEPRCWTKGEIIPLVVTANFNGHEVILSKLSYTVHGGDMALPYGSSLLRWNKAANSPQVLALRQYYKDGDRTIWIEPYSHESAVPRTETNDYIVPYDPSIPFQYYRNLPELRGTNESDFGVGIDWYYGGLAETARKIYSRINSTIPMNEDCPVNNNMIGRTGSGQEHEEVCPKNYNALRISLKLEEEMFNWCVLNECTSIKVYIAKGDLSQKSHLKSVGVRSRSEAPLGLYHKPVLNQYASQDTDYSQYGLLKEFVIEGEGEIPTQYENKETFALSPILRTNAWKYDNGSYWSVPISDTASTIAPAPMPIEGILVNNKLGITDIVEIESNYIKYRSDGWVPDSLINYRTRDKGYIIDNLLADKRWTPDFYIHDYAYNAPTLQLNTDGNYWDGSGCDVVSIIKGRAFIASNAEQAIVRYSAAQNGVILQDLFNKEDKITVGHEIVTAMMEFREQLCVFNRNAVYRIALPNIMDESTWEFLEAMDGQGTISPKTIVKTPYGLVFCNQNGIWFTDGREPENLGATINSMYLKVATNDPYVFSHIYSPGEPILIEDGFNPHLEIVYDAKRDHIQIISPIVSDSILYEIRFIYSFKSRSWYIERYALPKWENDRYLMDVNPTTHIPQSASLYLPILNTTTDIYPTISLTRGFMHFAHDGIISSRIIYGTDGNGIRMGFIEHAKNHPNDLIDIWWNWQPEFIKTKLITHELGDGENDFIGHKILFDSIARERMNSKGHILYGFRDYSYPSRADLLYKSEDPFVTVSLRNEAYVQAMAGVRNLNLSTPNMTGKIIRSQNPYLGDQNTPYVNTPTDMNASREAITMLMPINAKFRRARLTFISEITSKIYGIRTEVQAARRRFQ